MVRYWDDSERKRLEHVSEKYQGRLQFERPGGAVCFVDGDLGAVEGFLGELLARLEPGRVDVYSVERLGFPEPRVSCLRVRTGMDCREALSAFSYIAARLRGSFYYDLGSVRVYVVHVRGGWVRVRVRALEWGSDCVLGVEVEGYGDVVERLRRLLERELAVVGEVSEG